ncbi:hypothetical protein DVT68_11960 [Dyella solisilvae]|uniref:Uncharacterized protein n=1 Tax=Dyella solisilvae TaxID=1920168 RepID=A0A370K966_9GAMM|nr:hypothetical protein [Dyella solisilvae]RDI99181.1 hypothetical protein DVT68_11960 [Dyella solisilvae]
MRGRQLLALGLVFAALAGPALAAKTKAPTLDKQEVARRKALLAFQKDLVSVIAPQAAPIPLLGGALLARPLVDVPEFNSFHSLIERASQAEGAGPEINWVRLTDCDAKADACPNADAMDKLVAQAPDNAAVWLLKLGQDAHDGKTDAARDDLAKAAAAKLYDDYTGSSLKALATTVALLPPPPAVINPLSATGAIGVQMTMVFGLAGTQPQPSLQATARLCEDGAGDAGVKADCLKLGKLLEWGSSPLARSLGLHLREVLADDPAQQEDARRARRNLVWQVSSFSELSARATGDAALAQHLVTLARSGGTEMSLMLTALRDYNIAVDAPADWEPGKAG